MTERSPEEVAAKLRALGLWKSLAPYNFAIKPRGTAFPYFCTALLDTNPAVEARLVFLEGWQTFHDFVRVRVDDSYGFYSSPIELPHLELVCLKTGEMKFFRHDPCYMPRETIATENALLARLLWQAYGVMMRLETEPRLPLKFMDEQAMFGRLETGDDAWEDHAFKIPAARPHVESVALSAKVVKAAKDLPLVTGDVLDVDMRILPFLTTAEKRPRTVFGLLGIDPSTGETIVSTKISPGAEGGLRALWQGLPGHLLSSFVRRGKIPGEIRTPSGRIFRLLRPLCMGLPFKLTLKTPLPELNRAFSAKP